MLITKREEVTKQGFCKILWRKLRLREGLLLSLIRLLLEFFLEGVGWGGRLFEAGRLLTFSAFSMGAYSRWALIRGWAIIRINTVIFFLTLNYVKFGFPVAITYFLAHWSSGSFLLKKDNFLCAFYWLSQRLWKKQGNKYNKHYPSI